MDFKRASSVSLRPNISCNTRRYIQNDRDRPNRPTRCYKDRYRSYRRYIGVIILQRWRNTSRLSVRKKIIAVLFSARVLCSHVRNDNGNSFHPPVFLRNLCPAKMKSDNRLISSHQYITRFQRALKFGEIKSAFRDRILHSLHSVGGKNSGNAVAPDEGRCSRATDSLCFWLSFNMISSLSV